MSQSINYTDRPWLDPEAKPFIKVQSVSKLFGDFTAVDGVDLDIYKGELFCLLGGSGCGKSTLLRMLAGFETPTSGSIIIDGANMNHVPPYERPREHDVPVLCAVSTHECRKQCGLRLETRRPGQAGNRAKSRRNARHGRTDPVSQTQTTSIVRRSTPARRARTLTGQATQGITARRTAGCTRQASTRTNPSSS